jgi:hypothetical protein
VQDSGHVVEGNRNLWCEYFSFGCHKLKEKFLALTFG